MNRIPVHVQIAHEWVEASLDKAADLDDLDATREIAQTVRAWLASVDALDNLPTTPDILACQRWRNNAEMVAAILGLLDRTGQIPPGPWCDLTYGEHGGWWKPGFNPAPPHLVRCIGPDTKAPTGWGGWATVNGTAIMVQQWARIDFRHTSYRTGQFALTCYDPPYVLKGGKGKFDAMNQRYGVGLATLPDTRLTKREQLTALITGGFAETVRITKPKGIILAKAGQGTDGAKVFASDRLMLDLARQHKLEIMWELVFPTVPRSQKHRGPQQSPRCNYSKLFVFRKVK